MKILVTGSKGQVGSEICQQALASQFELVDLDRSQLDITDEKRVNEIITRAKPNLVINSAAYTKVDQAETEPEKAFAVNAIGARHIARVCQKLNIPLFHISTDYVFDGKKKSAYTEEDIVNPVNVYGHSKWEGEQAVRQNCSQHIILRSSWIFGYYGHNFVKTMLRLGQERKEIKVVSDQIGCPTEAGDIAKILLILARRIEKQKDLWGTYHYCGNPSVSWCEFAKEIFQIAKNLQSLNVETVHAITTKDYPTPAKRPKNSVLNGQKLMKTLSITPDRWQSSLLKIIQKLTEKDNPQ